MNVSGKQAPEVGTGKLVGMLLVTWLTFSFFIGLGNLIWLWNDMHYRKRAAIALGLSLATTLAFILVVTPNLIGQMLLASIVLTSAGIPWSESTKMADKAFSIYDYAMIPFGLLSLGMAIWMTIDAIRAYKAYKPG